jgi:hypothetical protein
MNLQMPTLETSSVAIPFKCPAPGTDPSWDEIWRLVDAARNCPDALAPEELTFLAKAQEWAYLSAGQYRRLMATFRKIRAVMSGAV